jgi:uncharacterized protein YggE
MARHRIRTAVVVSLVVPLLAAGCASGTAHPSQAAARPAASPAGAEGTGSAPALSTGLTGLVDQTPVTAPDQAPAASTPIVTTEGSGSASGTPSVMTLNIGVDTAAPHAGEALSDCNAKAAAVQQALLGDGVALADIQTSNLSLSPSFSTNSPTPSGYEANTTVVAKLRDLSKAGKVIDDAVAAAGDAGRLEGVSFAIDDSSAFASQARKIAVAQARSRADELAAAAGMKVAGLRSLSEDADQTPYGPFQGAAVPAGTSASAVASVPIQPGVEQTSVVVTAVWNLTPA